MEKKRKAIDELIAISTGQKTSMEKSKVYDIFNEILEDHELYSYDIESFNKIKGTNTYEMSFCFAFKEKDENKQKS